MTFGRVKFSDHKFKCSDHLHYPASFIGLPIVSCSPCRIRKDQEPLSTIIHSSICICSSLAVARPNWHEFSTLPDAILPQVFSTAVPTGFPPSPLGSLMEELMYEHHLCSSMYMKTDYCKISKGHQVCNGKRSGVLTFSAVHLWKLVPSAYFWFIRPPCQRWPETCRRQQLEKTWCPLLIVLKVIPRTMASIVSCWMA